MMQPSLTHLPPSAASFTGISIVIPVYNALDYAAACVESLYRVSDPALFEVIIVDNGSMAGDAVAWLESEKLRLNLWFLRYDEPLGFARAVNIGVHHARGAYVVILNSDTVVTDGWLTALMHAMDNDPALGVVSPITNHAGGERQQDLKAVSLRADQAQAYAQSISVPAITEITTLRLTFFCVMVRRALWELLGGLDEGYRTGNYEDDDFCLRTLIVGYRLGVARDSFVFHHNNTTFKVNDLSHGSWMNHNERRFYDRAAAFALALQPMTTMPNVPIEVSIIYFATQSDALPGKTALSTLHTQLFQNFELIAVTPDAETKAWLNTNALFPVQIVDDVTTNGFGANLRAALKKAQGRWVAFMSDQVILYPTHLHALVEVMTRTDAGRAAYTRWCAVRRDEAGTYQRGMPPLRFLEWWNRAEWHLERDLTLECVLVERNLFEMTTVAPDDTPSEILGQLVGVVDMMYTSATTLERHLTDEVVDETWFAVSEPSQLLRAVPPPPDAKSVATTKAWKRKQALRQAAKKVRSVLIAAGQNAYKMILPSYDARIALSNIARRRLGMPLIPVSNSVLLRSARRQMRQQLGNQVVTGQFASDANEQPDIFLFNIIEWSALKQRPQHLAQGLAARGCRVFWIDVRLRQVDGVGWWTGAALPEPTPNIHYLELPGTLPNIYSTRVEGVALDTMTTALDLIRRAYGVKHAVCIVNYLGWTPLALKVRARFGWKIVYDCLDNARAFSRMYHLDMEDREIVLTRAADAVTASAQNLYDHVCTFNPNTHLIRNGADYDLFSSAQSRGLLDVYAAPRIGFFGAFAEWLDFDLIEAAAIRFPDYSFIFVGRDVFPSETERARWALIRKHPNVHILEQVDHKTLAAMCAQFDITTVPFQDLPITQAMNTVKVYEYLAAGKPVIASDLPEARLIHDLGLITLYKTHDEYFDKLGQMVDDLESPDAHAHAAARRQFAAVHTWTRRTDDLLRIIERLNV